MFAEVTQEVAFWTMGTMGEDESSMNLRILNSEGDCLKKNTLFQTKDFV